MHKTNVKQRRKSSSAFRTISEVAEHLDVQQHVLRFWESKFTQIQP
ncbi:MAG: MerR family transcriptional regulator, partial [Pseudomonadota bacterium]|nr:MerR family transcriptional regulator [Pseudomonadota bacterium]